MVFVFGSVYVVNYVYRFAYAKPGLHPWDESYLIMIDLFNVLLISVCQYFVEDFCINILSGYWPVVSFFNVSLSGFGIRVILTS